MITKRLLMFLGILFLLEKTNGQNTIGLITNESDALEALTLFTPQDSEKTFLVNNCGLVVHDWESDFLPGNSIYLLGNGNLIRTGRVLDTKFDAGGRGGFLEVRDWDNSQLWSYTFADEKMQSHHDVTPLPNGNILVLAWESFNASEIAEMGRSSDVIPDGEVWAEQILEIKPIGSNEIEIVWEWHLSDHLIQNLDQDKLNYGIVSDHPELVDINFTPRDGDKDWIHANALDYNSELDQIIISANRFNEVWIIDHSTTSAEAAGHTGGLSNKGGDLLYRFGNPMAYGRGDTEDQKLFGQHNPHWIPSGLIDAGKILVFNNKLTNGTIEYSAVSIFQPPTDLDGNYVLEENMSYGPENFDWSYSAPNPEDFYSSFISGAQRLSNGNTLICSGARGKFFEINASQEIVWEYINPVSNSGILAQGDAPFGNPVFRCTKYETSYGAFDNRDLEPKYVIEANPTPSDCNSSVVTEIILFEVDDLVLYPNPSYNQLNLDFTSTDLIDPSSLSVLNMNGKVMDVSISQVTHNQYELQVEDLTSGLYLLRIKNQNTVRIHRFIKN